MQFPAGAKSPVGIVFDSAMDRIDDVLALAMLYGAEGKEQARIAAVAVSNSNLQAAQFCDALRIFYSGSTPGLSAIPIRGLPVGLGDGKPTAGARWLSTALANRPTAIKSIHDTAEPATLIRNALMAYDDQNAAVVVSGPLTDLAKLLDMEGGHDLVAHKVRLLCLAAGAFSENGLDANGAAEMPAARKVLSDWPSPVIAAGDEVGMALLFPGQSIVDDFAWASAHPVVGAYRAYRPMPYDAPSWAMAAMLYAVRGNENYFKLSAAGTIAIPANGRMTFTPSEDGKHRYLVPNSAFKARIISAYVELASAKPVPRRPHAVEEKKP